MLPLNHNTYLNTDSDDRVQQLKNLGFEDQLGNMTDDPDLDVKDRVKTAIQHFQSTGMSMGGGSGGDGSGTGDGMMTDNLPLSRAV